MATKLNQLDLKKYGLEIQDIVNEAQKVLKKTGKQN